MSIKVPRQLLTPEKSKIIRELLCLTPKEPFTTQKGYDAPAPEPVLFYLLEQEYISLPFTIGRTLFPPQPSTEKLVNPFSFTGSLKTHQTSIIDEATAHLSKNKTAFLAVYPGCGKTVMAINLAAKLPVPVSKPLTMILYHRLILEPQWLDTIRKFSNTSAWIVGKEFPATSCAIILCKETQFHKIPTELLVRIGVLIIDEAHAFCTPTKVTPLLATQPEYVIALSATPERQDGMHSMMDSIMGLDKVVRESKKEHTVIRFLTKIVPETFKNMQGKLDWNKLKTTLCTDELRNEYLFSLLSSQPDYKTAVLTWSYPHAVYLHEELMRRGESVALLAGAKKTYSDSSVLVGTIQKIGTGFDEQSACPDFAGMRINRLILMGTTKSLPLIEQVLGRSFRTEGMPQIIVFIDEVGVAKSHWNIIKGWCEDHEGKFFDLLPPRQIDGNWIWPELKPIITRRRVKKGNSREEDPEDPEGSHQESIINQQLASLLAAGGIGSDSD